MLHSASEKGFVAVTQKRETDYEDDTGPGWPPGVAPPDATILPSERPATVAEKFVRGLADGETVGTPEMRTGDSGNEDENTQERAPLSPDDFAEESDSADTVDSIPWSDEITIAPSSKPPLEGLRIDDGIESSTSLDDTPTVFPLEAEPPAPPSRRAMQWNEGELVVRCEVNGRGNNEDGFHIFALGLEPGVTPIPVLTIADGMGGHAHGEHASRETLRQFAIAVFETVVVNPSQGGLPEEQVAPETLKQAFQYAAQKANTTLRRIIEQNNWGYSGATLAAVAILGDTAVVINVGDSPVFHVRPSEGTITQISEDHSRAGVLVKAGLITPEMARFHEGRSQLLYHIGAKDLPDIAARTVDLKPGDMLLLLSDGVSGNATSQEIADRLWESLDSLDDGADRLIEAAQDAGETDNQTVVLYRHRTDPVPDIFRQPTVYMGR